MLMLDSTQSVGACTQTEVPARIGANRIRPQECKHTQALTAPTASHTTLSSTALDLFEMCYHLVTYVEYSVPTQGHYIDCNGANYLLMSKYHKPVPYDCARECAEIRIGLFSGRKSELVLAQKVGRAGETLRMLVQALEICRHTFGCMKPHIRPGLWPTRVVSSREPARHNVSVTARSRNYPISPRSISVAFPQGFRKGEVPRAYITREEKAYASVLTHRDDVGQRQKVHYKPPSVLFEPTKPPNAIHAHRDNHNDQPRQTDISQPWSKHHFYWLANLHSGG
ncbi:hypothetical protein BKA93DRAFT_870475 [Sparassis latifolia]